MYYLILDAEYLSTGIKSPTQGYLQQEDLRVSYQLWNEIIEWRKDYAVIILMPPNKKQKSSSLKKIDKLDKRGEMLIKKLLDELKFNVKIQYYSEGRQYLFPTVWKKENNRENPFLEPTRDVRHLIFNAYYFISTGIRDEYGGFLELEDLDISDCLIDDIYKWADDYYTSIILTDPSTRVSPSSLKKIDALDKEGVQLIARLLDELTFDAQIRYHSEGMLSYLSYYEENSSFFFNFFRKPKTYQNEFHNKVFFNIKNE